VDWATLRDAKRRPVLARRGGAAGVSAALGGWRSQERLDD
jgi:hypothetical protein